MGVWMCAKRELHITDTYWSGVQEQQWLVNQTTKYTYPFRPYLSMSICYSATKTLVLVVWVLFRFHEMMNRLPVSGSSARRTAQLNANQTPAVVRVHGQVSVPVCTISLNQKRSKSCDTRNELHRSDTVSPHLHIFTLSQCTQEDESKHLHWPSHLTSSASSSRDWRQQAATSLCMSQRPLSNTNREVSTCLGAVHDLMLKLPALWPNITAAVRNLISLSPLPMLLCIV